jgi:Spy/CpxP family protein refolding chaperone
MSYGISGVSNTSSTDGTSTPSLRAFSNLGLSDTQTSQIRSILNAAQQNGTSQSDVQSQIDAVLTPAQQSTLSSNSSSNSNYTSVTANSTTATTTTAATHAHHGHHGGGKGSGSDPFANLNLTSAQQSQIEQIFTSAKTNGTSQTGVQSQINAILTPTQQQQLQSNLAASSSTTGGSTT